MRASLALIYNEEGDVLSVSRKNDHNDLGLPGGRVEPNETDLEALIREVKEETGLDVISAVPYFERVDGDFIATVFDVDWTGTISSAESAAIKWVNFDELLKGSFGEYNRVLESHIRYNKKYKKGQYLFNPETYEEFTIIDDSIPDHYIVDNEFFNKPFLIKKSALELVRMHKTRPKHDMDLHITSRYACLSHLDVNQYYDNTYSYGFHLAWCVRVGRRFKNEIPEILWQTVEKGIWCHDIIEDTGNTFNDVKRITGPISAELAFALTNEKGKTRDERANAKYYKDIKNLPHATFCKLCDRIANVEYSKKIGSSMYLKYKKEFNKFKNSLYVEGEYESMWNYLNQLFE